MVGDGGGARKHQNHRLSSLWKSLLFSVCVVSGVPLSVWVSVCGVCSRLYGVFLSLKYACVLCRSSMPVPCVAQVI